MTDEAKLKGRYELRRKLGEGTQGETFEAFDHGAAAPAELGDQWNSYVDRAKGKPLRTAQGAVAIKCFRVGAAKAWKDVELAEREARTLASLDHPKLPRYIDHFEENGVLYLVMEKIEGESLATLRARKRPFSAAEVTRMIEEVGGALAYLHGRAPFIVHRDVKPGNILRRPDGSFALVDFGAVRDRLKLGGGSTVVGTFGYMAPEQFQGRAFPRSDLYGLAATAIAMLTGEEPEDLPHEGLGIDVARALPRGTPAPLARALTAMLVPDPDRRVSSVEEALAILRARVAPASAPAPPIPEEKGNQVPTKNRKERRRERKAKKVEDGAVWKQRVPRAPVLPRVLARVGLLVARLVVWVALGLAVPLVLVLLSLVLGGALRRAASAMVRMERRTQLAFGRASDWLSGIDHGHENELRVRIQDHDRVRAVTPEQAQRIAIEHAESRGEDADAWLEERLRAEGVEEEQRERERMRLHARPPKGRHWGR